SSRSHASIHAHTSSFSGTVTTTAGGEKKLTSTSATSVLPPNTTTIETQKTLSHIAAMSDGGGKTGPAKARCWAPEMRSSANPESGSVKAKAISRAINTATMISKTNTIQYPAVPQLPRFFPKSKRSNSDALHTPTARNAPNKMTRITAGT